MSFVGGFKKVADIYGNPGVLGTINETLQGLAGVNTARDSRINRAAEKRQKEENAAKQKERDARAREDAKKWHETNDARASRSSDYPRGTAAINKDRADRKAADVRQKQYEKDFASGKWQRENGPLAAKAQATAPAPAPARPMAQPARPTAQPMPAPTQAQRPMAQAPAQQPAARPAPAPVAQQQPGNYQIQKGDTLSGIAKKQGLSVSQLMSMNTGIKDANKIQAGQSLNLGQAAPRPAAPVAAPAPRPAAPAPVTNYSNVPLKQPANQPQRVVAPPPAPNPAASVAKAAPIKPLNRIRA